MFLCDLILALCLAGRLNTRSLASDWRALLKLRTTEKKKTKKPGS
jgi:hypothetical protein